MYARIAPAKFCHIEYKAPGTVAEAKDGKCALASPEDKPEFWDAISIAMVTICFFPIPVNKPTAKPNAIAMKYCNTITTKIVTEEVKIACLFDPITPTTIRQITSAEIVGR